MLSSTALHWIPSESLARLYGDLGQLLRPGGVLLNGDHMAFGPESPALARLSQHALDEHWSDASFAERGVETAEQWWDALAKEPGLDTLLAEKARRFDGKQRQESPPGFAFHVAALRDAGFREVGTVWQILSNRVLLAVR